MKDITKRVALVGASIILALLVTEILLRIIHFSVPNFYEPDPRLGWSLQPGAQGWYTDEGRGFMEINSAGMRGSEHKLAKPDDVYRIAVIGDSYSEAKQVPFDSMYTSLLPSRLESCGFQAGKRIETLNFGVSGYGTAQELILLRERAVRYQPDMVLLQFTGSNDVRNNSPVLEQTKIRPFFVLGADGTLHLDDSFATRPSFRRLFTPAWKVYRRVAPYSRLAQLVRAAQHKKDSTRKEAQFAVAEAGLEEAELFPPSEPQWEEAWRVTEALLVEVSREAARHQAETLVVTVPWPAQLLPDPRKREAFAARVGVPDLEYPDRRVEEFGRAHDIPVLTLAPGMARAAEAGPVFLNGFGKHLGIGHWNPAGHRAAAEVIASSLCSRSPRF